MPLENAQDVRKLLTSVMELTGDTRTEKSEAGKPLSGPDQVEQLLRDFLVDFFGMEVKGL